MADELFVRVFGQQSDHIPVRISGSEQTVGDRTLTFEYDLPDGRGKSQQMNVTAREFAYVTNNSPSNACTLGYGTKQTYTYTVYTHPDHAAVVSTDGLSGTAVSESFSAPPCGSETGDGALNSNGQFTDDLVDCSNQPLTCSKTVTQTLKVAGYQVRTNTVTYSGNGAGYTSNGPSQ